MNIRAVYKLEEFLRTAEKGMYNTWRRTGKKFA